MLVRSWSSGYKYTLAGYSTVGNATRPASQERNACARLGKIEINSEAENLEIWKLQLPDDR